MTSQTAHPVSNEKRFATNMLCFGVLETLFCLFGHKDWSGFTVALHFLVCTSLFLSLDAPGTACINYRVFVLKSLLYNVCLLYPMWTVVQPFSKPWSLL